MVRRAALIDEWPEDYVKAVGQVAIAFTGLDYILRLYIKSLIEAKFDVGMGVTLDVRQNRQLLDIAYSLFKIRFKNDEPKIKEFEKLLKRCKRVAKRRNTLMHRLWTYNGKGQVVSLAHKVLGRAGLKARREVIRVSDLDRLHRDIKKLRIDLLNARKTWNLGRTKRTE